MEERSYLNNLVGSWLQLPGIIHRISTFNRAQLYATHHLFKSTTSLAQEQNSNPSHYQ